VDSLLRIVQPVVMAGGEGTSEWQRRYDDSLAQEAAASGADDTTGAEFAALEASGCLPGWAGATALGLAAAVAYIRRSVRRSRSRHPSD
jgi:hypothetical protein